jgi:hypothetical protein
MTDGKPGIFGSEKILHDLGETERTGHFAMALLEKSRALKMAASSGWDVKEVCGQFGRPEPFLELALRES